MIEKIAPLAILLVLLSSTASARHDVQTLFGLRINTTDNVTLTADASFPVVNATHPAGGPFPVLIFPNSWAVPEIEYITKNLQFAAEGYVTLEYQTRGWYFSGGHIDTAGPKDRQDITNVIDFVERHAAEWNADMTKIAFIGISYGAGLSLEAVGHDARVTTACSLSGWVNLTKLLYYHQSPNMDAISLLKSGAVVGRLDPSLIRLFDELLAHTNISHLIDYANERSPGIYLPQIINRQVPIFISNNLLDRLFVPQEMLDFYEQLPSGYRFMMLNQGGHAMPEGIGLFISQNAIWTNVRRWLDYWLKGIPTGIMQEPSLQMQLGDDVASTNYQDFSNYKQDWQLYFGPRGNASVGTLHESPVQVPVQVSDVIGFTLTPTLIRNGPDSDILSALLGVPFVTAIMESSPITSLLYMLQTPLQYDTRLCGTPRLSVIVKTSSPQWQLYGYLYDVNPAAGNNGTVISDFEYTNWIENYSPYKASSSSSSSSSLDRIELRSLCRKVPAGHTLAIGFVLYSKHREPANNATEFQLGLEFGVSNNFITLPYVEL